MNGLPVKPFPAARKAFCCIFATWSLPGGILLAGVR
jgi:hypothetical protein